MVYFVIFIYLVMARLLELVIAKSNEEYQKKRGAIEIKDPYYPLIVLTHSLFFIFLLMESYFKHRFSEPILLFWLTAFILVQLFRYWCLFSLGKYWNTKVIVRPNSKLVKKGPYKWIKHPNYIVVGLEFLIIPILFHSYLTAIIFLTLHILLMQKRIPLENNALKTYSLNESLNN